VLLAYWGSLQAAVATMPHHVAVWPHSILWTGMSPHIKTSSCMVACGTSCMTATCLRQPYHSWLVALLPVCPYFGGRFVTVDTFTAERHSPHILMPLLVTLPAGCRQLQQSTLLPCHTCVGLFNSSLLP